MDTQLVTETVGTVGRVTTQADVERLGMGRT
jgi:hypothetical protein